jgi:signal transduction histidine kinase
VATLVAQNVSAAELLSGVAHEVGRLLDVQDVMIERFEDDRAVVTLASVDESAWPVGRRWELDGASTSASVFDTGRPARIDDYTGLPGTIAAEVRRSRMRSSVGVPIVVGDRLWGVMCVGVRADETLPPETEGRLTEFTNLVATAISNADARDSLHSLAAEQAALRRLATLVAERTPTGHLYTAVAEEVGQLLDVATVNLVRYDPGHAMTVLASLHNAPFPVGSTWPLDGDSVTSQVFESGLAVRVDDYSERRGPISEATRGSPITSSVGVPIVVGGTLWGMLAVGGTEPLHEGIETRLRDFTELVATAVSDASARAELMASRARLVTAGDEARRRIERNLHDGTQQRLVTIDIGLRALESKLGSERPDAHELVQRIRGEIGAVIEEVREISRGLHPSALAEAGLASSVRSLARRAGVGVDLTVDLPERPPEPIEIGVYYLVSEALTNIVKHAHAQSVTIEIAAAGSSLGVTVADDGVGGARMDRGSGLEGLVDRVEALGGRLTIESPATRGTRIVAVLPFDGTGGAPEAGETRAHARVSDGRDTSDGGTGFVPSSDPGEGD